VQAATFNVNSSNDQVDANIGDGTCTTSSGCTLRAAIQEANALAASGPHRVNLPAGTYTLSIAGPGEDKAATGDLDIIKANITIAGDGMDLTFIDANHIDRVFDITPEAIITIRAVTIRGGAIKLGNQHGGGIRNAGVLTLDSVHVTANDSGYTSGFSTSGGGISNTGNLTLLNKSAVTENKAENSYGGIQNNGTLKLTDSTIRNNETHGDVGGIGHAAGSNATLENCAITGNTAERGGGIQAIGPMTLTNCTISGNVAHKGDGGAIWAAPALLRLINTTVTGNTSGVRSGFSPSGIYLNGGTAYLRNTIVNEGGVGCGKQNSSLSFTSEGYNIDRETSCGLPNPGAPDYKEDKSSVDPLLDATLDTTTFTHALLPGSPAIDAVPVYNAPATDQRGVRRPQFACSSPPCFYAARSVLADIGAYELVPDPNKITLPIRTLRPRSINIFTGKAAVLVS
jgi:CSLREA domain-containing protein